MKKDAIELNEWKNKKSWYLNPSSSFSIRSISSSTSIISDVVTVDRCVGVGGGGSDDEKFPSSAEFFSGIGLGGRIGSSSFWLKYPESDRAGIQNLRYLSLSKRQQWRWFLAWPITELSWQQFDYLVFFCKKITALWILTIITAKAMPPISII